LDDPSQHGLLAPTHLNWGGLYSGEPGTYTREGGYLAYYEICEKLISGELTEVYDEAIDAPYAYGGDQWVGYDNKRSIAAKAAYAKSMQLGGVMFWAIDIDDFNGNFCGQGKYPLVKQAYQTFFGETPAPEPETTQAPVVTTHAPVVTTGQQTNAPITTNNGQGCTEGGFTPHATDCSKYYGCLHGSPYEQQCGSGLWWSTNANSCDWPANVDCCDGSRPCNL
jgi:chitinase